MTVGRHADKVRECVQAYIAAVTDEDGRQSSIAYWDQELDEALSALVAQIVAAEQALPVCGLEVAGFKIGCGQPFASVADLYRCATCSVAMHVECLREHFLARDDFVPSPSNIERLVIAQAALREISEFDEVDTNGEYTTMLPALRARVAAAETEREIARIKGLTSEDAQRYFDERNEWADRAEAAESRCRTLEQEAEMQAINHEYVVETMGALSSGVGLARLALQDGRWEEAQRYLDDAVEKCPDFSEYMARYDAARAVLVSAENRQEEAT